MDIVILDEEGLLKVYLKSLIDKIIVSRSGEIEIVEKQMNSIKSNS